MTKNNKIEYILASASPRRKDILKLILPEFKIIPSQQEEKIDPGTCCDFVAEKLARLKGLDVAKKYPESVVIGCDTVVVLDDAILGKPEDDNHAYKMLKALSGKTHKVITGVCIAYGDKVCSFSQTTFVSFYELSDKEIKDYIKTGEPFDKAGAYGIQGEGAVMVKQIQGDFFNVVGLPVARLKRELKLLPWASL